MHIKVWPLLQSRPQALLCLCYYKVNSVTHVQNRKEVYICSFATQKQKQEKQYLAVCQYLWQWKTCAKLRVEGQDFIDIEWILLMRLMPRRKKRHRWSPTTEEKFNKSAFSAAFVYFLHRSSFLYYKFFYVFVPPFMRLIVGKEIKTFFLFTYLRL